MRKSITNDLVLSALFVALGVLFPIAFHAIFGQTAGKLLTPMHFPVLLCGFVCGAFWGGLCGMIVPFVSSFITGMPPLFPMATSMSLELLAYGAVAGLLVKSFPVVWSLLLAMLAGRIVYGLASATFFAIAGWQNSFTLFFTGAFVTPLLGIVLQIIAIPVMLAVLKRAKVAQFDRLF